MITTRLSLRAALATTIAALCTVSPAPAATFTWQNTTGTWSTGSNWAGGVPTGTDPTDILIFGGNLTSPYISTNNLGVVPAVFNQLRLQAVDTSPTPSTTNILDGTGIRLAGTAPEIQQTGSGGFTINLPIELGGDLLLSGNGTGVVTMNAAVSGAFDITKTGTSTFRFGTPFQDPLTGPSANSWYGTLTIGGGTIRFNNNAQAGRTALRSNPVHFSSAGTLTVSSALRVGTLSGNTGVVQSQVTGSNTANEDIVIHAFRPGTFGGTLILGAPTGIGDDPAVLAIRGNSTQTFTGTLQIEKDVDLGFGATAVLAGSASLGNQTKGAIVLQGGTFKLDNTGTNNNNRVRNGDAGSTSLDTVGGGLFSLIGNASAFTNEIIGRLQLGTGVNPRSGHLEVNVTQTSASFPTQLTIQSLSRNNSTVTQFSTVDFSASDANGNPIPLGQAGNNPRITFNNTPPLVNGLLRNTDDVLINSTSVGWATVNGSAFATYSAPNGIAAVIPDATPAGNTTGSATSNVSITGDFVASSPLGYTVNSLRLEPTAPGQSFSLTAAGNLKTNGILLAGPIDYTINGFGTGGIGAAGVGAGQGTRYIHVQEATLTVNASVAVAPTLPLVKAGKGTLVLGNTGNSTMTGPLVINGGEVRATLGTTLPSGEIRFRGGVLEIVGGGTFSRNLGSGTNTVNWEGVGAGNAEIEDDRGSGGFAAIGSNVTIDLNGAGATNITWNGVGFLDDGYALTFGSRNATAGVIWTDNIALSSPNMGSYNARQIHVYDNPSSNSDFARISGAISGSLQADLAKTGPGRLELTGTNTYAGATLVEEGTLLINGNTSATFLANVKSGATIGGNGQVGPIRVEAGGEVAPGNAIGNTSILTTRGLKFMGAGAKLTLEAGGATAGGNNVTGYDRIVVNGTVELNGADISLFRLGSFTLLPSQYLFIIDNDGTDPVVGEFAQTELVFGSQVLGISYTGDIATNSLTGGNDVVLFVIPEPGVSTLALLGLGALAARRRRRS